MNKQQALQKIEELQQFVQELDKPKLVRVYVKRGLTALPTLPLPYDINDYSGTLLDVFRVSSKGNIQIPSSTNVLSPEWVIFVEGSFEDLEEK